MDEQTPLPRTAHDHAAPPRAASGGRIAWLILLLLLAAGVVLWLHPWSRTAPVARVAPPQSVGVTAVVSGDLPLVLSGLGTVTPLATVSVQSQISGVLTEVGYKEGQMVKAGDFLAQIDPRPYQAALAQAQGVLAHDQGLLDQARIDLTRYQTLIRQDSIARQQVDDQFYLVHQYEGTVQADHAAVDTQKLNLIYCHITAPVDGRVGLRLVDPGNYVQANGGTNLVVVTQLQPITVIFTLPEDLVAQVQQRIRAGATLSVTAFDRANNTPVATGTLLTIDNVVDVTTGTFKLRAIFPNTDDALFPSQFVNANLLVDTLHGVALVPNAAIQSGAPGTYVYVLNQDSTVSVRVVKTGAADATRTAILSGVAVGERVVIDGLDRLRDGAKVVVPSAERARPQGGAGR